MSLGGDISCSNRRFLFEGAGGACPTRPKSTGASCSRARNVGIPRRPPPRPSSPKGNGASAWRSAFSHLHHHVESHQSKPCHAHSHETRILSPALSLMNSAKSHGNESGTSIPPGPQSFAHGPTRQVPPLRPERALRVARKRRHIGSARRDAIPGMPSRARTSGWRTRAHGVSLGRPAPLKSLSASRLASSSHTKILRGRRGRATRGAARVLPTAAAAAATAGTPPPLSELVQFSQSAVHNVVAYGRAHPVEVLGCGELITAAWRHSTPRATRPRRGADCEWPALSLWMRASPRPWAEDAPRGRARTRVSSRTSPLSTRCTP